MMSLMYYVAKSCQIQQNNKYLISSKLFLRTMKYRLLDHILLLSNSANHIKLSFFFLQALFYYTLTSHSLYYCSMFILYINRKHRICMQSDTSTYVNIQNGRTYIFKEKKSVRSIFEAVKAAIAASKNSLERRKRVDVLSYVSKHRVVSNRNQAFYFWAFPNLRHTQVTYIITQ